MNQSDTLYVKLGKIKTVISVITGVLCGVLCPLFLMLMAFVPEGMSDSESALYGKAYLSLLVLFFAAVATMVTLVRIKASTNNDTPLTACLIFTTIAILTSLFFGILGVTYLVTYPNGSVIYFFPLAFLCCTVGYIILFALLLKIREQRIASYAKVVLEGATGFTSKNQTLCDAILNNDTPVINNILSGGINVNETIPSTGANALWVAAAVGNTEVFKLLLEKGGDMNNTNKENISVMDIAQKQGHQAIVDIILARQQH